MRPGCVKVESRGSLWWFDDMAGEYLRLPKTEKPRERSEWSDGRAGILQDGVWLPMVRWWIDEALLALRVEIPNTRKKILAPEARIVGPT